MWDTIRCTNILILEVPEREKNKVGRAEKIAENFLN